MSLFSKVFFGIGAFLLVVSAAYAVRAQEYEGLALSLSVMLGALLVGLYAALVVRRARAQLAAGPPKPGSAADDEAHVRPTIWPLVLALSTAGLVVGAVTTRWALVPGGILFVAACVGWVVDIQRQWRHHGSAHSQEGHGAAEGHPG